MSKKQRLTFERLTSVIGEYWDILSCAQNVKTQDFITCKCRTCGHEATKKAVKFIELINNHTHGCSECRHRFEKSPEFSEIMRQVNQPFIEQQTKAGRERMLKLYESCPDKKEELTKHFRSPELRQKCNEKKRLFYSSMTKEEKKLFFAKRKRPLFIKRDLAAQGRKRKEAWDKLTAEERRAKCNHLIILSRSEKMREVRRASAIKRQLWAQGSKKNTKPEREIREELGLNPNEKGVFFRVPNDDPLYLEGRRAYEVDIYIPDKKIGIEHNGLFVHSEKRRPDHQYHLKKLEFFKRRGIRLIQIWQNQWKDRPYQVTNFLRSALGANKTKVHARKCQISLVKPEEANAFVDKYHIQGRSRRGSEFAVGLFLDGELLTVATFGKHHRNTTELVLNRLVSKYDVTVVGGLGRISRFASNYCKTDIVTWADRCLTEGDGYLASGWIQLQIGPVDYFYVNSDNCVISKQSRQKKKIKTPVGVTEFEHAKLDGLYRCWDCGKIKFRYPYQGPMAE